MCIKPAQNYGYLLNKATKGKLLIVPSLTMFTCAAFNHATLIYALLTCH